MFYLTTLNTFIYGYNYSLGHTVKDCRNNEVTHYRYFMGYLFQLEARDLLYAPSHTDMVFVTPVVEHWLK